MTNSGTGMLKVQWTMQKELWMHKDSIKISKSRAHIKVLKDTGKKVFLKVLFNI